MESRNHLAGNNLHQQIRIGDILQRRIASRVPTISGRILVIIGVACALLGCISACFAGETPLRNSIESPVPKEVIVGTWSNETGESIKFSQDGTLEYQSAGKSDWNRVLHFQDYPASTEGSWLMCAFDIVAGEREEFDRCGESTESALWIIASFNIDESDSVAEDLVFTGSSDDPTFYIYNVDSSISNQELFSKEDQ